MPCDFIPQRIMTGAGVGNYPSLLKSKGVKDVLTKLIYGQKSEHQYCTRTWAQRRVIKQETSAPVIVLYVYTLYGC